MTDLHADGVRLTPTTIDRLNSEDISGETLARSLGVAPPASWPPLYNGPETREWMRRALLADVANLGWFGWYIIATIDGTPTLAGTAGYKGPPDANGEVEIGYSVVPEYHRRGIASTAVRLLCGRALAKGVTAVLAETLPTLVASQGVLAKAGFKQFATYTDPDEGEVWRYRLER
jgi:RimJ/RimL family protein N-acetyltransferase